MDSSENSEEHYNDLDSEDKSDSSDFLSSGGSSKLREEETKKPVIDPVISRYLEKETTNPDNPAEKECKTKHQENLNAIFNFVHPAEKKKAEYHDPQNAVIEQRRDEQEVPMYEHDPMEDFKEALDNDEQRGSVSLDSDGSDDDHNDDLPRNSTPMTKEIKSRMELEGSFWQKHNKEGVQLQDGDTRDMYSVKNQVIRKAAVPRNTKEAMILRVDRKERAKKKEIAGMTLEQKKKALIGCDIRFSPKEWAQIIANDRKGKLYEISRKRISESLIKGIPDELRGYIWVFLCQAKVNREKYGEDFYDKLVSKGPSEKVQKEIDKDVIRTKGAVITKAQLESLTNILSAYARLDNELGYAQGMNYIVYYLLDTIEDEELSFWCLYDIMFNKNWRLILKDQTPKFFAVVKNCRRILYQEEPKLYKRMVKCKVPFAGIFSQYYISLFAYKLPKELVIRVLDVFLYEGEKKITQILIKLFKYNKKLLLSMDEDEVLEFTNNRLVSSYLDQESITSLVS
ncbi:unnamed protein product [Moneuplotes crassus]|uniref:Rab-GAP TBC domain-containing protein n=1 Tax=Euplotes crassus TaxID=5936 RepID=A0AAD1UG20_EUPCR|nr:unnamed protein product [Moneuplotes crassus]